MSNETKLEDMKYNELKTLAKDSGLDASGTKEDLVTRLTEAGINGVVATDDSEDDSASDLVETPSQTASPKVNEQAEEKKATAALRNDARAMKAHLDAQPKVSIMIPFEVGENPVNGKNVPFHCNLNGYALDIPRGVYVDVPRQVADMIKERLESEGKIGAEWRLDRNADKQEALG